MVAMQHHPSIASALVAEADRTRPRIRWRHSPSLRIRAARFRRAARRAVATG